MPPTTPASGPVRSAAAVQAEIHALMVATGGWLWGPTRARYQALRDEWVAAEQQVRAEEITTAA